MQKHPGPCGPRCNPHAHLTTTNDDKARKRAVKSTLHYFFMFSVAVNRLLFGCRRFDEGANYI